MKAVVKYQYAQKQLQQLRKPEFMGRAHKENMEQCDDCLCKECLENCNENPNGCCYTCSKDSDSCYPTKSVPVWVVSR